jgi:hypothetical protein
LINHRQLKQSRTINIRISTCLFDSSQLNYGQSMILAAKPDNAHGAANRTLFCRRCVVYDQALVRRPRATAARQINR